jgi:CheY-like chemotaxis protein
MPVMDGWSFCAHQQQQPELASIPVALMSATHNLRSRPLPCVPVAIIEKPFDLDVLLRDVASAVGGAQ